MKYCFVSGCSAMAKIDVFPVNVPISFCDRHIDEALRLTHNWQSTWRERLRDLELQLRSIQ